MQNEKNGMELLYDEYLHSSDRKIDINGVVYYKIVKKDFLEIGGKPMNIIVVPKDILLDNQCKEYCDENEKYFQAGFPVHFCFRSGAPLWYRETLTLPIYELDIEHIGKYVRQMPEIMID